MNTNLAKDYLKSNALESTNLINLHIDKMSFDLPEDFIKNNYKYFEELKRYTNNGKKFRYSLINLGFSLFADKNNKEVQNLAAMFEIFHSGLLIHDDIMDEDEERRGGMSLHLSYADLSQSNNPKHEGLSMAILLADIIFFYVSKSIFELNFDDKIKSKLFSNFTSGALRVGLGQMMDILPPNINKISSTHILSTYQLKTAEYTGSLPLILGATAADANAKSINSLRKIGNALGWAYQIQDDILGIFGTQEQIGKPVGSDIREGKLTILQLYLHELGNDNQLRRQKFLLSKKENTMAEIQEMRELLFDSGAYKKAKDEVKKYIDQALKETGRLTRNNKNKEILTSLIYLIANRES
jgi:geranylgeranyl diphosphate synthase type I